MKKYLKSAAAFLLAASMLAGCSQQTAPEESAEVPSEDTVYEVKMGATVTDAGQYVDKMTIDFGDVKVSGVDSDTFEVYMTSTVDYGESKGSPYAYYDASTPLPTGRTAS